MLIGWKLCTRNEYQVQSTKYQVKFALDLNSEHPSRLALMVEEAFFNHIGFVCEMSTMYQVQSTK